MSCMNENWVQKHWYISMNLLQIILERWQEGICFIKYMCSSKINLALKVLKFLNVMYSTVIWKKKKLFVREKRYKYIKKYLVQLGFFMRLKIC